MYIHNHTYIYIYSFVLHTWYDYNPPYVDDYENHGPLTSKRHATPKRRCTPEETSSNLNLQGLKLETNTGMENEPIPRENEPMNQEFMSRCSFSYWRWWFSTVFFLSLLECITKWFTSTVTATVQLGKWILFSFKLDFAPIDLFEQNRDKNCPRD